MILQHRLFAIVSAALVALHLSTADSRAADGNRPNLGNPKELINHPICWTAEEADPSRHCDFAQRP